MEASPWSRPQGLADSENPAWRVEIGLSEIAAVGGIHRFGVRMAARTTIRKSTQAAIVYDNVKEVESETELTETEWVANDSKALRSVLDQCLEKLTYNLAVDLVQPAANFQRDSRVPDPVRNSSSCDDNAAEWTARPASSVAASVTTGTSPTITSDGTTVLERSVASGQEVRVNHHARWDSNCNSSTSPRVWLTLQPQHGRVETNDAKETVGTTASGNVSCSGVSMRGTLIRYVAPKDYKGLDTFEYLIRPPGAPPQKYAVRVLVQ